MKFGYVRDYKEIFFHSKYTQQHRNWLANNGIKHTIQPIMGGDIDRVLYYPVGEKERKKCERYFERQEKENRV